MLREGRRGVGSHWPQRQRAQDQATGQGLKSINDSNVEAASKTAGAAALWGEKNKVNAANNKYVVPKTLEHTLRPIVLEIAGSWGQSARSFTLKLIKAVEAPDNEDRWHAKLFGRLNERAAATVHRQASRQIRTYQGMVARAPAPHRVAA